MASPDYILMSRQVKRLMEEVWRGGGPKREPDFHVHGVPIYLDGGLDIASGTDHTAYGYWKIKPKYQWGSFHDGFGLNEKELKANGIIIDDPHEEKTMSDAMRRMMFSYPHRDIFESMLGIKSEPLKPGSTVLGPDGHEYIIGKLAPKPKAAKPPKKDYNTVGVRYLEGGNLERVYTYRVKKGAKLHLGQEVVVPAKRSERVNNFIAIVVEIHKMPQDNGAFEYRYVIGTVKPL